MRTSILAHIGVIIALSGAATTGWLIGSSPVGLRWVALFLTSMAVLLLVLGDRAMRLEKASGFDTPTGLFNRGAYEWQLAREIRCAVRCRKALSLSLIDVDHFKAINDRDGHSAGDRALHLVAQALRQTCRSRDLAFRWGGDEFVVLAPSTAARDALVLTERIRATLRRLTPSVTVSIGVADLSSTASHKPQELFDAADQALYRAKAGGRDRAAAAAAFWTPTTQEGSHADSSHPCAG